MVLTVFGISTNSNYIDSKINEHIEHSLKVTAQASDESVWIVQRAWDTDQIYNVVLLDTKGANVNGDT